MSNIEPQLNQILKTSSRNSRNWPSYNVTRRGFIFMISIILSIQTLEARPTKLQDIYRDNRDALTVGGFPQTQNVFSLRSSFQTPPTNKPPRNAQVNGDCSTILGTAFQQQVPFDGNYQLPATRLINQHPSAQWQQQQQPQNPYNPTFDTQPRNAHLPILPQQIAPVLQYAASSQSSQRDGYTNGNNNSDSTPIRSTVLQQQPARNSLHKALMGLQNPRLLGGDILLKTGRRRAPSNNGRVYKYERSALVSPINLWPNGLIYFELDPSVAHLTALIYKVMQQFHDETCIRFIPREDNEPDFLHIESLRGCFSYIGRIGGEQTLSLGDGCEYRGTIAHELLHAVGFYHHQNRSDRDEFLEILWDNIAKGKEGQFSKMAPHENILLNDFDYNSIMLYGPHTFGKTLDKITMKPKREGVILLEVVEKQGLSALDIDSVNKLYRCGSSPYIE